jgi:hypothetical protein
MTEYSNAVLALEIFSMENPFTLDVQDSQKQHAERDISNSVNLSTSSICTLSFLASYFSSSISVGVSAASSRNSVPMSDPG